MDVTTLDFYTWYTERCLGYKPRHFVLAKTVITQESHIWIYSKLKGRFTLLLCTEEATSIFDTKGQLVPAFEDPEEAVLYELTWS